MVEDWRSQVVGGMESALTMWEACCVPSLLHGAGTWVEITPAALPITIEPNGVNIMSAEAPTATPPARVAFWMCSWGWKP